MTTLPGKYSTIILVFLLLTFLVLIMLFPSAGLILGITFLSLSFVITSFVIVKKHRGTYLQGKITRAILARNIFVEMIGILIAMAFAGLLGRTIAEIATRQISHDLLRLAAGIIIGLLIGISVGVFMKRTWGRLVKISPEN